MITRRTLSLRWRIILLVLGVALVPLGFAGLWLARGMERTAEVLLQQRVGQALDRTTDRVVAAWVSQRTLILDLADVRGLSDALSDPAVRPDPPAEFLQRVRRLPPQVRSVAIHDAADRLRWTVDRAPQTGESEPSTPSRDVTSNAGAMRYRVPVWDGLSDRRVGTLDVFVESEAILPLSDIPPDAAGMTIGIFDMEGRTLRPVPFDEALLEGPDFSWGGERWVTRTRHLREPPVRIVVTAPASPLMVPFERAARQGSLLLFVLAMVGFVAALALSRKLTRSLEDLAGAAQAVSAGDFHRQVADESGDEIGLVAAAFNVMTRHLQRTMEELAQKESLAAIGEFAASLAHEIRNPLTAVRVDLQRTLADLPPGSGLEIPLERSLSEIDRLDQTVNETLHHARIGRSRLADVDIREALTSAAAAAQPFFADRGATLDLKPGRAPLSVQGDAEALRHVFLNLFRNAAEALGPGGHAEVRVASPDRWIEVVVTDTGAGIPDELQARVFEPLFTTRSEGTGLGLAIVRRTVEAHGGDVALESRPGRGTSVTVRLPAL